MKAKDLMIGDWVYDKYHKANGTVTTTTRVLLWVALSEGDHNQLKYDEVSPIPLTAEILLANGFERNGSNYVVADDYYDVVVHELSDSVWEVQYTDCEMSLGSQQAHVCHVHQLQHALRLFGVNKEIRV